MGSKGVPPADSDRAWPFKETQTSLFLCKLSLFQQSSLSVLCVCVNVTHVRGYTYIY